MQGGDQITLVAAGMAAHQHLAALARADRKAWASIIMHRTAGHPCCARAMPAEEFCDWVLRFNQGEAMEVMTRDGVATADMGASRAVGSN